MAADRYQKRDPLSLTVPRRPGARRDYVDFVRPWAAQYDMTPEADQWNWRVILSDHPNSRYKSGGISFVDNQLYWISDANIEEPFDRGVFRCAPADIKTPGKHDCLFNPGVESGCMVMHDGVFLASHCAPASPMNTGIIVSADAGETWAQYDIAECGARSPVRFHEPNSDGWFRVDLRTGWIDFAEVLFIKIKPR